MQKNTLNHRHLVNGEKTFQLVVHYDGDDDDRKSVRRYDNDKVINGSSAEQTASYI